MSKVSYVVVAMRVPERRYRVTVRADTGQGEREYTTAVRRGPLLKWRTRRRIQRMLGS